jgi:RHS repeat-associated protein
MKSEESNRNASVVSYLYDAAGNRASLSLDGQLWVTYAYDDASRLLAIARGPSVFGLEYDDANRRTRMTYPNAIATSYSYDNLNRLTGLTAVHNGATTITSFGYSYDDAGNRLTKATHEFTEAYTYDPLYRLRGVERTGGATSLWQYGYDAVGNRLAAQVGDAILSSTYDERNQLRSSSSGGPMLWRGSLNEAGNVSFTSALVNGQTARMLGGNVFEAELDMTPGTNTVTVQATDISGNVTTRNYAVDVAATGASYTYDPNGNLTSKTEGSDTWAYTWNAENQLTKVEKNSVEVARFAYDPIGRRVEKAAGGVTTSYTYDGHDILREARGAALLKFVHGEDVDEPLAFEDGASLFVLHADALGSVVKVTDAAGAVTSTRQYDGWGNQQLGTTEPGYAFTGREWDPETRLYYYRARYYDPKIGRFVSEDPIPFVDGPNPLSYVGNNPATFRDPLGLATDSVTASLEAAIRNGNAGEIQAILDTAGDVLSPAAKQAAQAALRRLQSRAEDIIARDCLGKINRVFPEEMRQKTLQEIINLARQGNKAAQTARKLLTSGEYLK